MPMSHLIPSPNLEMRLADPNDSSFGISLRAWNTVQVDDNHHEVLEWVTHFYRIAASGKAEYFLGHYFTNFEDALKDFKTRFTGLL